MKTANLHVDNIAPTLACMEVLTSVAKRLALRDWRITHEAEDTAPSGETLTSGFVGVEISRFSKTYSERHLEAINALIDPLWETYYGWFGYQLDPSSTGPLTTLAVWFYCRSKAAAERLKRKLRDVADWKLAPAQTGKPDEKNFVVCSKRAMGSRDEDSFMRILTPIIPEVGQPAA